MWDQDVQDRKELRKFEQIDKLPVEKVLAFNEFKECITKEI
jgi:hypothetical protein